VVDFFILHTMDEYKNLIADKLKDIDIGLLILNAGGT
jgi:hypothetical protein